MEPCLSYNEYAPPPALRTVVRCFWTSHSFQRPIAPVRHRIAPDGCMDWLFDFGSGKPDSARVIGTMSKALDYVQHGVVDLLGVRQGTRLKMSDLFNISARQACMVGPAITSAPCESATVS